MKRIKIFLLITLCLGVVCSGVWATGNPPSNYYVDQTLLPFDALPNTVTDRSWGVHEGAGYRIEIPKNWNHKLVLYCHGYMGYGPVLMVSNPSIRQYLIDHGYAWAASSYSTNGYDPEAGVRDTHNLAEFFTQLIGKPKFTYIMGHSMGGHVIGAAIEQYPKSFDGALPMCGVMGDSELFDYFFDYQVVAQGLTGVHVGFPFPSDYSSAIVPGMETQLGGAYGFPYTLSPAGIKLRTATKYFSGGARPLFDQAFLYWGNFLFGQGIDGTLGFVDGNIMGNLFSIYQLDDNPWLSPEEIRFNFGVLRVAPDWWAKLKIREFVPYISGEIRIPVLTLHTIGDLFVPLLMEQIYAERVAWHGKSRLLVQRAIRDVGHCGFTAAEQEAAFADLVKWVENGQKPLGDDLLNPKIVANPKFGCQFTQVQHISSVPLPWEDPSPWACTSH